MDISGKMKLKDGMQILVLNAPPEYAQTDPMFANASNRVKSPDQIHWFVRDSATMRKELEKVYKTMQPTTILWVLFPKKSSGIKTDLSRDKGWDALEEKKLHFLSLISFNETWSAFGCRLKSEKDEQKLSKPKDDYSAFVDTEKRMLTYPDDMKAVLAENPDVSAFFTGLSFSHRKEYLLWIVSAKRAETRAQRLIQFIDMLKGKRKNPADKAAI